MSSYLVYNGLNLQLLKPGIEVDYQLTRSAKKLVGTKGSNFKYLGSGGRVISFTILARGKRVQKIQGIKNFGKAHALTSKSQAKYNGKYHVLSFGPLQEYEKGSFKIPCKLQEDFKFNVVKKNFKNYEVKAKSSSSSKVGMTLNCSGIWLKNGSKGDKVKKAQQLLQRRGYYKGKPVDGIYGPVTVVAVKSYQRNKGWLKVDGIIGPVTCKALQS